MSPRRLLSALVAATMSLTLAGGLARSAMAATPPASTVDHTGLFAQDWNGAANSRTAAQWQAAAQTHDVIVGSGGSGYTRWIPQLRAWNPRLTLLVYDLGPYTVAGSQEYQTLLSQHPDYFAHDAQGRLITVVAAAGSPSFPSNTLMDWGNPGWRAEHAQRVASEIAAGGWDGAYLDSMGLGAVSAPPIDTANGQPYNDAEWAAAGAADLNAIKAAIGSRYLMATGLVNGPAYQSATHYLAQSNVDGLMTDSWLRLSTNSPASFPSPAMLQSNLDMVSSLQAAGKGFYGWTKVWTSASQAQMHAWDSYALAAYLLVRGATAYYDFTESRTDDRTTVYFPEEVARLGAPLGPYGVSNGVYTRAFQNGSVTLNANTGAATINAGPPAPPVGAPPSSLAAVRGTDGAVWVLSGFSQWQYGYGTVVAAPAALLVPASGGMPALTVLAGVGADHRVWIRSNTQVWQPLTATGEYCVDNPALTLLPSRTLEVACMGGDGGMWVTTAPLGAGNTLPVFGGWQGLGGRFLSGPALGAAPDASVFGVGLDSRVWGWSQATGWHPYPWLCTGHPAVAQAGSAWFFACDGLDHTLWVSSWGGSSWLPAHSLGGSLVDGVGLAGTSGGVTAAVEGTDHSVWFIQLTPGGAVSQPWRGGGGSVTGGVAASGQG